MPESGFKQGSFHYKIFTSLRCRILSATSLIKKKKSLHLFPASSPRNPSFLHFSSLQSLDNMGTVLTGAGERPARRSWQEQSLSHLLMKISWAPGAPSLGQEQGGGQCVKSAASEAEVSPKAGTAVASWAGWNPWVSWAALSIHLLSIGLGLKKGVGVSGVAEDRLSHTSQSGKPCLLVNSRGSGGRPSFGPHQARELLCQLQNLGVYFLLLVLQIYNKLRKKTPPPSFFPPVGLSLSSQQCLGFPQSYQVLI